MGSKGYGFHFATTLSALHFLVCGIFILISQARKKQAQPAGEKGKGGKMPLRGGRAGDWPGGRAGGPAVAGGWWVQGPRAGA